jgi:hypothetical protein
VSTTDNTTVEINGRQFRVEQADQPDMDGRTKYVLRVVKGRGLTYTTMRNAHKPHLLFCVNPNSHKLPNIWLVKEGDTLRQVEVI